MKLFLTNQSPKKYPTKFKGIDHLNPPLWKLMLHKRQIITGKLLEDLSAKIVASRARLKKRVLS